VYLEVYPSTSKILLETTTPTNGLFSFSPELKSKYVRSLYASKQISKSEFENSNTEILFNKYYFSSEGISLIQLAGLQYSNFAIYHLDDKKYSKAVSNCLKAQFLYPCQRHEYYLKYALQMELSTGEYSNMDQVRLLGILFRFNNTDSEISDEVLRQEFNRIINTFLINESNVIKTDSAYGIISANITDTVLKNNIDYIYHYEMSRYSLTDFRDSASIGKHLRMANTINPNNADLHRLIVLYFLKRLQKLQSSPPKALDLMDDLSSTYPFLKEDDTFNSGYAECYLELTYRSFVTMNALEGEKYLAKFEKVDPENKLNLVDTKSIEKAYSTAAGYYFKKGNNAKSKNLILKGLEYIPDSFLLKEMKRQL